MVAVPSTFPATASSLVALIFVHRKTQGEGSQGESAQMSTEELTQLLGEALDDFDDPTPLPTVDTDGIGRRCTASIFPGTSRELRSERSCSSSQCVGLSYEDHPC